MDEVRCKRNLKAEFGFRCYGFRHWRLSATLHYARKFQVDFSFSFFKEDQRWSLEKIMPSANTWVSQYRFTAARVQWPCSTVSIKPFWSLKCSGQVCTLFIVPGLCKWISAATKLWADYRTLVSIRIFRIACGGCNFYVFVCAGNDPASKITITLAFTSATAGNRF